MAVAQRFQRITDFHGINPGSSRVRTSPRRTKGSALYAPKRHGDQERRGRGWVKLNRLDVFQRRREDKGNSLRVARGIPVWFKRVQVVWKRRGGAGAVTPPALRPCACRRGGARLPPPFRKRRIVKPGSSARPALTSDCASSSLPKLASAAARKKCVSGIVRLISIERRNNATASSLAPRVIFAAPSKCSQSQAKLSRGERRRASFS